MKGSPLSPSAAGAALGSIKTPKKAAAARANGFKKKPLSEIKCTCDKCPDVDSPDAKPGSLSCPRGRTIYQRRYREAHNITIPTD